MSLRRILLRAIPERWREAVDGDLAESAGTGPRAAAWSAWQIVRIAIGLRTAALAEALPYRRLPVSDWIHDAARDTRYGIRRWAARPGLALAAVATLALGIGTTAALFSVVDGVLLKPLPYADPERLMKINRTYPDWLKDPVLASSWDNGSFAWREFFFVREHARSFESIAVITTRILITQEDRAQELRGGVVSSSFFDILGVEPILGANFDPEADRVDPGTMLLGHEVWRTRFGADPGIVGRTVRLHDGSRIVAGVLPAAFSWGPEEAAYDVWLPLAAIPEGWRADNNRYLDAFGRLRAGVSIEQAVDEMTPLLRQTSTGKADTGAAVRPMLARELARLRTPLFALLGGALLLLAIACANVAGLLTADAVGRDAEMAVRTSLGAGLGRLVRQLLAEAVLLSAAGAAGGLLLAGWAVKALVALAPTDMPRITEVAVDWRVALVAVAAATSTAIVFALLPALTLRRASRSLAATAATRTATGRRRAADALAVVEIALGIALVSGAFLFSRTLVALHDVDTGFERSHLVTLRAGLPPSEARTADDNARYFAAALDAVRTVPGVEQAALSNSLAFVAARIGTTLTIPGRSGDDASFNVQRRYVSDEYFAVLGIPTLAGRLPDRRDTRDTPRVVVVSREMSRILWPDGDAVGRTILSGQTPYEVIAVVDDVREMTLRGGTPPTVYMPIRQQGTWAVMRMLVRTKSDPLPLAGAVREAVSRIDPAVPIEEVATMDEVIARVTDDEQYRAVIMSLLGGAAALLAAVGLYGTLARRVADRQREIGVRLALGARPAQVHGMFAAQGLRVAFTGIALGVPLALALGAAARTLLFGVSPSDPALLAAVAGSMMVLAVVATWLPSARASRVDPATVLRRE